MQVNLILLWVSIEISFFFRFLSVKDKSNQESSFGTSICVNYVALWDNGERFSMIYT